MRPCRSEPARWKGSYDWGIRVPFSWQPNPSGRAAAAQALGAASDRQALSVLQTLLQDQQPQPRLYAAKALGKLSLPVLPMIKKGLHDSDPAVRITAAGSLLNQLNSATKSSSGRGRKG